VAGRQEGSLNLMNNWDWKGEGGPWSLEWWYCWSCMVMLCSRSWGLVKKTPGLQWRHEDISIWTMLPALQQYPKKEVYFLLPRKFLHSQNQHFNHACIHTYIHTNHDGMLMVTLRKELIGKEEGRKGVN